MWPCVLPPVTQAAAARQRATLCRTCPSRPAGPCCGRECRQNPAGCAPAQSSLFTVHPPLRAALPCLLQTVSNILGTLPPQFFRVTISTAGENLAQLMYSVCLTGYMFRNAWLRLELKKSLGGGGGRVAGAPCGVAKRQICAACFGRPWCCTLSVRGRARRERLPNFPSFAIPLIFFLPTSARPA